MKDELKSCIIKEGVWLKSKSYAMKIQGKYDKKKNIFIRDKIVEKVAGKGVKECVKEDCLTYDKHVECLNKADKIDLKRKTIVKQNIIKSDKHKLQTISMTKVGLSCFDIKRMVNDDNTTTRPFGYIERSEDIDFSGVLNSEETDNFIKNLETIVESL